MEKTWREEESVPGRTSIVKILDCTPWFDFSFHRIVYVDPFMTWNFILNNKTIEKGQSN